MNQFHIFEGSHSKLALFPGGTVVKNLPANAEDARTVGSIPVSGRAPGEGNGSPLQYSCQKKSHGRRSLAGYIHGGARVRQDLAAK